MAELTPEQEKENALKVITEKATEAAKEAMPELLKQGLSSDEAKKAIATIVNEAFKTAKITDSVDNTDKTVSEIVTIMQKQHDELAVFVEKMKNNNGNAMASVEKQVSDFVEKNFEKIKEMKASGSGLIELVIKAPATVTTASGTTPDGIPVLQGTQVAPLGRVNLRTNLLNGLVNNFNTGLASYAYTEAFPKDGDFAFVAEGALKPEIDFRWETRYAAPKKLAAWTKLTDEAVQDIPGLQSVATGYLRDKHDIRKQRALLFGTGVGEQPLGATLYARVFSAGPMALAVENPNFMDVVNAGITDVFTTHNYEDEMPYMANLVLVNPVDFFINVVSAKTVEGTPLYPTASLFNRVVIGGVTIIPEEMIPAGKIFIGDMSRYNVSNYLPYTVKIGWVNDDFIRNQFVILGESRFHAFVRNLDKQAFIYDNIATIKTAIAAV